MTARHRQSGFSLTEVLLAVVTLAIGMLFVGGTFVLGVHFSRLSTERSIGAIVAEEACAKLRLYDVNNIDPNGFHALRLLNMNGDVLEPNHVEYTYPSTEDVAFRQYRWSAIGRRLSGTHLVQIAVFVLRTQSTGLVPEKITDPDVLLARVIDGMRVVRERDGSILRVSGVGDGSGGNISLSDSDFPVWMVGPDQGRNPCVGIFQKEMHVTFGTLGGRR